MRNEPVVLAARLVAARFDEKDELYVVERVKRGIYAVCALGSWVNEGSLVVASEACGELQKEMTSAPDKSPANYHAAGDGHAGWLEAARIYDKLVDIRSRQAHIELKTAVVFGPRDGHTAAKEGSRAEDLDKSIEPSNPKWNGESVRGGVNFPSPEHCVGPGEQLATLAACDMRQPHDPNTKSEQSHQEILDGLRKNYLEALYISKVCAKVFQLY